MRFTLVLGLLLLTACGSAAAGGCPSSLPADQKGAPTGCLQYSVSADSRTYAAGTASIAFTATATNVSSQPCGGSSELVCGGPGLQVLDANGKRVWTHARPVVACPLLLRLLQPGESMSTRIEWQSPQLPAGLYSVTGFDDHHALAGTVPDFGRSYFGVC